MEAVAEGAAPLPGDSVAVRDVLTGERWVLVDPTLRQSPDLQAEPRICAHLLTFGRLAMQTGCMTFTTKEAVEAAAAMAGELPHHDPRVRARLARRLLAASVASGRTTYAPGVGAGDSR